MRGVLRRGGQYVLVVWAAVTLNFALPHLAPGDPVEYLFSGDANALSAEGRDALRAEYGIDGPLVGQYTGYWAGVASADLGLSLRHNRPVTEVLLERLPWTLALVGIGTVVSAVVGTLAGATAAWRRRRRRDIGLVSALLVLDAMPGFWIGMILIATFAVELGWLPSFGAVPLTAEGGLVWLTEVARRLVLPVATMALATLGSTFLLARASMLATLDQPYVLLAEAKGVPPRGIVYRHALRNALLPVSTNVMLSFGLLLSGAVVVETVFSYPGVGRLVYDAVIARDYPLLQGAFLLVTIGVVLANLAADLVYPLLDPRVRRPGVPG